MVAQLGEKSREWLDRRTGMNIYILCVCPMSLTHSRTKKNQQQVWGFEMINGQRHHSRRVVVAKDGKYLLARLVYDYNGPNTE